MKKQKLQARAKEAGGSGGYDAGETGTGSLRGSSGKDQLERPEAATDMMLETWEPERQELEKQELEARTGEAGSSGGYDAGMAGGSDRHDAGEMAVGEAAYTHTAHRHSTGGTPSMRTLFLY